ncbi:MAG: MFS transporter, partial [Quisquiliibacterium sp.]
MFSQIDSLTGFYLSVIMIAIGSSFCGYFPLTVAVVQWFEKKRARALSMMSMGLALGGIFVPAVAWSMQTFGWRITAFGSGVAAMLIGFPLARMFKRNPEEIGERIDGEPAFVAPPASAVSPPAPGIGPVLAASDQEPAAALGVEGQPATSRDTAEPARSGGAGDSAQSRQFTAGEAMRTSAFWLLAIGHGFALLVVSAVNVHAIPHMNSGLGYSLAQA